MEVWQIIGAGILFGPTGIVVLARIIYVSRNDPWWSKAVGYVLALIVLAGCGFAMVIDVEVYETIGDPVPRLETPQPPTVWWR